MKKRKHVILSLLLSLSLVFTMMPLCASADDEASEVVPGTTEETALTASLGKPCNIKIGWNENGERFDNRNYWAMFDYYVKFKPSKTGVYNISLSNSYKGYQDCKESTVIVGQRYKDTKGKWHNNSDVFDYYASPVECGDAVPANQAYLKAGYTYYFNIYLGSDLASFYYDAFDDDYDFEDEGKDYYKVVEPHDGKGWYSYYYWVNPEIHEKYKSFEQNMGFKVTRNTKYDNIKAPTIKSLSRSKKSFTVKWSKPYKNSFDIEYQIMYSTSPKFTHRKVKTIILANEKPFDPKPYKKATKKISKLKSKKKYYVKVRTRKYMDSASPRCYFAYSPWSKVKTVRTK